MLLCAGNLYVFFHPAVHPFGLPVTLFDFGALIGAGGMVAIAIVSFVRHTRILYDAERLP